MKEGQPISLESLQIRQDRFTNVLKKRESTIGAVDSQIQDGAGLGPLVKLGQRKRVLTQSANRLRAAGSVISTKIAIFLIPAARDYLRIDDDREILQQL